VHSALFEIPHRLRVTPELPLIESCGMLQRVGRIERNGLLFEVSEALAEGEMPG